MFFPDESVTEDEFSVLKNPIVLVFVFLPPRGERGKRHPLNNWMSYFIPFSFKNGKGCIWILLASGMNEGIQISWSLSNKSAKAGKSPVRLSDLEGSRSEVPGKRHVDPYERIGSIRLSKEREEDRSSLPFLWLKPFGSAVWKMGDFISDSTLDFFLKKPGGFIQCLNPVVDPFIRKSPKSNLAFLALPV